MLNENWRYSNQLWCLQVKKVRAKLRDLRVQLFRLASRLGYSDHNLVKTIKYRSVSH